MTEFLDVKMKVRKVGVQDGIGFGVEVVLEGVDLQEIIRATNTALNAKGSKTRIDVSIPEL